MKQYYVNIRGEWRGPIDLEEMQRLFWCGAIDARTPYSKEGWSSAREAGELMTPRAEPPPVYPPPKPQVKASASLFEMPKNLTPGKVAGLGCLFLVAIFFLVPAIAVLRNGVPSSDDSGDRDAHYTAEQFIMKQYPGAKSVSSYRDSIVEKNGNTYVVAVTVDGLNAFGGPVRKQVGVEMTLNGGTWKLVQIKQR